MEKELLTKNLSARDQAILWHPYTQHKMDPIPIPIVRGKGAYLYGEDGTRYIDVNASWWTNLHGHAHPYIAQKIFEQASTLEHIMFADFTHEPAIRLAERLQDILFGTFTRFFYSDNGSTAVETALKMAFQYWYNQNPENPRTKMISLEGGYHGETFGALSASSRSAWHRPFRPFLFDVEFIPPPFHGQEALSLQKLKEILDREEAACFIFEPMMQLFGQGMRIHSAEGLNALVQLCQERNVLTIADEVMTGFGRTGPLFACDRLQTAPDMVCLSKALSGGALPLAVTACTETIYEKFLANDRSKAFLNGHTYTGNPLGCAAALANLDLLLTPECARQREWLEQSHLEFKKHYGDLPQWRRCEVLGTIMILEYNVQDSHDHYFSQVRHRLARFFLERRLVIRPFGNTVHIIPPYCLEPQDLDYVYKSLIESVECL